MKATFTIDGEHRIDLARLIETRCLIQANSGGGKSYLIRKLLEETHGKVQQIVLDMEGEFATLREKFDYILAGKGGDIPADPKSADLLARKILELEASLIIDLYELKHHERIRFVRNFIDAMINAPKELYHPVMVVIDEAHVFVPEKGESEAMSAVVDLASRGRKRGYCAVLATQRLSKLHKDVAAECLNKFIGRTSLDIDRKRAADELGFLTAKDSLALRKLDPGQFYAFGPAVSDDIKLLQVGAVKTSHPKAGQRVGLKPTKPTEQIRQVLQKLVDLPQEAADELRDKESMTARIRELERELKHKPAAEVDPAALQKAEERGFARASKEFRALIEKANRAFKKVQALAGELTEFPLPAFTPTMELTSHIHNAPARPHPPRSIPEVSAEGQDFGLCERKILGFLLMKEGTWMTKVQVGAMTGYKHGSGGFNAALSNLSKAGLIIRESGGIAINPTARDHIMVLANGTPHRLEDWIAKLGACERAIYQLLLGDPTRLYSKAELAETTGYSAGSGGFNNALARLSTVGLIARHSQGRISINSEIMGL